jgi:hypothetical protein
MAIKVLRGDLLKIRIPWTPQRNYFLPLSAVVLCLLFILFLLPISGVLGGLAFILVGWLIPTLVNVIVSWWITLLLPVQGWTRVAVFLCTSFLLGVNTSLPTIVSKLVRPPAPELTTSILRRTTADAPVDFLLAPHPDIPASLVLSQVSVGSDEGCGCMYFVPQKTYYSRLSSLVQVLTKSKGHREFNYSEFPQGLAKAGVHLNVYSEPDPKSPDRTDLHIDVFDKADRTASFVQRNLPSDAKIRLRTGRDRRLLNGYFYSNCTDMLLHNNIWAHLLENTATYFPAAELRTFFSNALALKSER